MRDARTTHVADSAAQPKRRRGGGQLGKKALSVFMSIVMVVGLCPGLAFANDGLATGKAGGTFQVQEDQVTVTFDSNGGSAVDSKMVKSGATVDKPADPTRAGYKFMGWYTDNTDPADFTNGYDFSAEVTEDLTLYAKWASNFTVRFDLNYTNAPTYTTTVTAADGDAYNATGYDWPTPTRNGFSFAGWYTSAELANAAGSDGKVVNDKGEGVADATISRTNATLYAAWGSQKYEVTFKGYGATEEYDDVMI